MGSLIPDTLAGKDFTFSSIMKLTRFVASFFLLTQVVVPFIRAAPQNSRAAMDYEAVCASQLKPIQKQGRRASPQKELRPFLREPFLKISLTLSPTLDFLLEASLGAQRQWMLSRRGARMAWWLTSTPPPMPTSRCLPPSAGWPPWPTSRPRLLERSQARQKWRRLLHT